MGTISFVTTEKCIIYQNFASLLNRAEVCIHQNFFLTKVDHKDHKTIFKHRYLHVLTKLATAERIELLSLSGGVRNLTADRDVDLRRILCAVNVRRKVLVYADAYAIIFWIVYGRRTPFTFWLFLAYSVNVDFLTPHLLFAFCKTFRN